MNIDAIEELNELILIFEGVFEMGNYLRPDKAHLKNLLNKDTFFAVVAKVEDKIIGGLTVYVLDQYYSQKPLAYIYDLAVSTEYQRNGIGQKLIYFTNDYCKKMGFGEVFVQADKGDDHAIDFYRSTMPTDAEQVVHFYYNLTDDKDI